MKEITVKERIYKILLGNSNGFLTCADIAKESYDIGYVRDTRKHLDALIKRNMSHGIAMLHSDGYVVVVDKKESKVDPKKRFKVLGYKIADLDDSDMVIEALNSKKERLKRYSELFNNELSRGEQAKLLDSGQVEQINVINRLE